MSVGHRAAVAGLWPSPGGGQDRDRKGARTTAREDREGEEKASATGSVSGSQGRLLFHRCITSYFFNCHNIKFSSQKEQFSSLWVCRFTL